jgi:hypothetical protein
LRFPRELSQSHATKESGLTLADDGREVWRRAGRSHLAITPALEPLARKATLGGDGDWHVADVPLPQPGRWHLRIDALTPFQNITLEDEFDVPAR